MLRSQNTIYQVLRGGLAGARRVRMKTRTLSAKILRGGLAGAGLIALSLSIPLNAQPPHIKKMLEKKMPAMAVTVADVREGAIQAYTWYSGTLISRNDATLAPESDGKVVHVAGTGSHFNMGDVMVQLDDTLLVHSLNEVRADIKNHTVQITFLNRELARLSQLVKGNNVSVSEYEQMKSQLDSSQAMLEAAQARSALMSEQIKRMQIRAPFDGVVSRRYVDKGEWIKAGTEALDFVDLQQLEIAVQISAKELSFIQLGDTINVTADAAEAKAPSPARVKAIVPVGDKQSRLFELRLDPPEGLGLVGQLIRVAIPNSVPRNSLVVPEDALVIRADGTSVFIIGDKMIAKRIPVETGRSQNGMIEVSGRLQPGDKVVIRGGERLRDGIPVRLTKSLIMQ